MGDIKSPSTFIDSLITPFSRSFSISLIKKDSSLNENFISVGSFLKEKSSSQISKGIFSFGKPGRNRARRKKDLPSEADFFFKSGMSSCVSDGDLLFSCVETLAGMGSKVLFPLLGI